jgi:hypothetical protein
MCQPLETPDNNYSRGEPEHARLVDVPPTAPDWADMARAAWDALAWQAAAAEYHNKNHQSAAKIEPERLQRLRHLMDNDVSLERAWSELNDQRRRGEAATAAVEALIYSLRRGVDALAEPDTARRLAELSDDQLLAVGERLRRLKPKIARVWSADEVATLIQFRERLK